MAFPTIIVILFFAAVNLQPKGAVRAKRLSQ